MPEVIAINSKSSADDIEIQAFDRQTRSVLCTPPYSKIDPGQVIPSLLILSRSEAQSLMDTLYDCGLRPNTSTDDLSIFQGMALHDEIEIKPGVYVMKVPNGFIYQFGTNLQFVPQI